MLDDWNLRSLLRIVSGEPIRPPRSAAAWASGLACLPLVVLVPHVDRAGRRPPAAGALAVEAQRELEEGVAVGPGARLLVGLGAHEERDQGDVWIGPVVGEPFLPLHEGIVVGVHPGVRGVGGDELEAERAHAPFAAFGQRLELRAGDP